VIGGKMVIAGGLDKLGIGVAEIARGKRALLGSPLRPWSDDERALVRRQMEEIYTTFKARVAEGRKLDPAAVEQHAQGRVFTGAEARARGLVDELGSLEDALAAARAAAKLPADAPLDVYPGEPTLLDLLGGLTGARAALLDARVAALLGDRLAAQARGLLELALSFTGAEPGRAVAFLPAIR
jgi:protease-4